MSDSEDDTDRLFNIYDPFFDTYLELLEVLHELGIEFSFKQRVPLFKVYTHLSELEQTDKVRYAKQLIDCLRDLMARGLEPEHKGDSYV